jgi:hypothetical protein
MATMFRGYLLINEESTQIPAHFIKLILSRGENRVVTENGKMEASFGTMLEKPPYHYVAKRVACCGILRNTAGNSALQLNGKKVVVGILPVRFVKCFRDLTD